MTDYHWTPANQRLFLEALAETGCVSEGCSAASMSRRAAYNLRARREGAAFRMGWDAAQLIARCVVADTLMERALLGQTVEVVRDPETRTTRSTRCDGQLGRALLTRLDRLAEADVRPGSDAAFARIISQDFEAFLDLIEQGGTGTAAALFVAARDDDDYENQCELAENSALFEDEEEHAYDPRQISERRAHKMTVWWDDLYGQPLTNFPPPQGFSGEEESHFGANEYFRTLTRGEQKTYEAIIDKRLTALRTTGETQRDHWLRHAAEESSEDAPIAVQSINGGWRNAA
jgi:hypothetical protein